MPLSADEVRWVAHLARLELNAEELATMTRQLDAVLQYFDQLKQINTDGIEPLAHPLPLQNIFRKDEPAPSLCVNAALANAPQREGDFYCVPDVLS
jgi:aspartyl-tRNA(Asn)/glutamyl-tRNA(Gln) amidotransferase subunit C